MNLNLYLGLCELTMIFLIGSNKAGPFLKGLAQSDKLNQENAEIRLADLLERIKRGILEKPGFCFPPDSKEFSLAKASVAVILRPVQSANELYLLLVKRKIRRGDPWSGNIAFPGGRYSEKDKGLLATVIREVTEETGLDLREFSILGALDEIVSSNYLIRVSPYVAVPKSESEPQLKIENREIEGFVWIPLSYFMNERNRSPYFIERSGQKLEVPSFHFRDDYIIWGMTLRIIENLVSKIKG